MSVNKCSGSWDATGDQYAQVCVPNKVNNMNIKKFDLMSWGNETRFLVPHELWKCKCGLNESVCNSNQNGIIMNIVVSVKN